MSSNKFVKVGKVHDQSNMVDLAERLYVKLFFIKVTLNKNHKQSIDYKLLLNINSHDDVLTGITGSYSASGPERWI